MSYTVKTIDELESIHHGAVKLAGDELGIRSFGLQVLDFPAGFSDYPEHDHAEDGQEEVYVVLRGQADFAVDGEHVTISQGEMIKVDATSKRKLQSGEEGVTVLAIGSTPGAAYQRPEAFRSRVRA
ncbi:MAG: cupin domain-containing protein [Solirubrobacterales bacterium]|nr:cupin domain-containing protein [Solirubrobacterales bacterium]MBV9473332.1 cupin domain-containing protein [Solirubrobacterales bacterium]